MSLQSLNRSRLRLGREMLKAYPGVAQDPGYPRQVDRGDYQLTRSVGERPRHGWSAEVCAGKATGAQGG